MKSLRSLYRFLGSVYLALILIAATALFVVAGTFIESATQSHQHAALFTYDTPLFAALLWGFFINILVSAIRRWPFRWKHVPFLTTHLGLLMILAGVLIKHYYGVQGSMMLLEGTGSQRIIQANTYAIQVDQKGDKKPVRYPLRKSLGGSFIPDIALETPGPSIRLGEFAPHCSQHLVSWIKGPCAVIRGIDPLPLLSVGKQEETLPLGRQVRFSPHSLPWKIYALKTSDVEHTVASLYANNDHQRPFLAIILDETEQEGDLHFVACYQGQVWSESLIKGKLDSLIAYEDGFLGYATRIEIPFFPNKAQEDLSANQLELILRQAVTSDAELPAPLQRLKEVCETQNTDFPRVAAEFLLPLVKQYQLDSARQSQIEASRSERGSPSPIGKGDEEDQFSKAAASQNGNFQLEDGITPTSLALETSVVAEHRALPPGKKLEDNMPMVTVVVRKGKQAQHISLAYDKTGSGLKWPVLDGQYLLRFQPQFKEIPYRLRLRHARQINYPNSSQPYSFESDLMITDQRSMIGVEKTISMNQVHETWDGYRFYLSAMTPADETAVKQVQIVVNHDPAKYFLTYPGAFVLSCGILMLFILRPFFLHRKIR